MTVVKINAITVPAESGDELARRFAARAGAVDNQPGFEGFELLKPTDERTTWLVVTRWRDEESFQAWLHSPAFGRGHRPGGGPAGTGGQAAGTHPAAGHAAGGHAAGGHAAGGHSAGEHAAGGSRAGDPAEPPVSTSSELWSYEIAGGSAGAG
jgi:heme oxygenase (mycobilin-producing)